jgi:putative phosphoesterase
MKLLIASDIHGSATWCERLMDEIERESPDKVVLLGDLLYHGPRNDLPLGYAPKRVFGMLNGIAQNVVAVRGNCEAEVDQMVLAFPCMADYAVVMDGPRELYCTHGHLWATGNLPPLPDGSAFLYGHTHVKQNEDVANPFGQGVIRAVNPGSISLPKDGQNSYALYVDGEFQLRAL